MQLEGKEPVEVYGMSALLASEKADAQTIFWYRELPPLAAEPMEEHTVEASSGRVSGTIAYRGELWTTCYADAMAQVTRRLEQEIERLDGRYARVLSESVDSRHSDATGEAWLHIVLTYMLYH